MQTPKRRGVDEAALVRESHAARARERRKTAIAKRPVQGRTPWGQSRGRETARDGEEREKAGNRFVSVCLPSLQSSSGRKRTLWLSGSEHPGSLLFSRLFELSSRGVRFCPLAHSMYAIRFSGARERRRGVGVCLALVSPFCAVESLRDASIFLKWKERGQEQSALHCTAHERKRWP